MRRNIFIIPILLLVISCHKNTESKKLLGSWKMRDVVDQTEQNFSEKTTFYKDSMIVEMFANKQLSERFSNHYKFDTVTNIIHYEVGNEKLQLTVLKLTDSEMEILIPKSKKPIRFIKIE